MPDIRNCTDHSTTPPRLRLDISGGNLWDLPDFSTLPKDQPAIYAAVAAAGFQGVQGGDFALCATHHLARTGSGRVDSPADADTVARKSKDAGENCCTLHVGTGMEDDDTILRLVDAIINASLKHDHPLYIETHRATITQDLYRTVWFTNKLPAVRFNGDFSHWYTGLEMVYGDLAKKLAFIDPVLARTRFMHGRIGSPGSIQVHVGDTLEEALQKPFVQHFMKLWTHVFTHFLATARPGDFVCFTPELLPAHIYYARLTPDGREESDRWQQAQLLAQIAQRCFADAQRAARPA